MISLDNPLPKGFRFYDAQMKYFAPSGYSINQITDALYAQWQEHASVRRRYGGSATREDALSAVMLYLRQTMPLVVSNIPVLSAQPMPAHRLPEPPAPKASKCCRQK